MLITKNGTTLNVTKGAFNALFKHQGWKKANKKDNSHKEVTYMNPKPNKEKKANNDIPFGNLMSQDENEEKKLAQGQVQGTVDDDEEDDDDDDFTVILEDMNVKQLIEYADEKDIDLGDAKRKDDIIAVIKAAEE